MRSGSRAPSSEAEGRSPLKGGKGLDSEFHKDDWLLLSCVPYMSARDDAYFRLFLPELHIKNSPPTVFKAANHPSQLVTLNSKPRPHDALPEACSHDAHPRHEKTLP